MKGHLRLMSWSRLARIVESILRSVLDRVMGLKLDKIVWSWFFFGIRMVCVSFHDSGGVWPADMRLKVFARMGARLRLKCL